MLPRSSLVFLIILFFFKKFQCKVPFFLKIDYCNSLVCETMGRSVENHLNQSVDPCENFYQFSCKGWISKRRKPDSEPVWSNWQILSNKINERLEILLGIVPKNVQNSSLTKTAKFYNTCINSDFKEPRYLNNLKFLIKSIRGWPIIDQVELKNYDWFRDILKITRLTGANPIFKIDVNIDSKNTSLYTLYIEPGDLIYPSYILNEPIKYSNELKAYKIWIFQTIRHLYRNKIKRNIKPDILKIIQFEMQLASFSAENMGNSRFTLSRLSEEFPSYNWKKMFGTSNLEIGLNDTIIIKNFSYFKNILRYIPKIDSEIIANYLIWYLVKDLSRETGPHMRLLSFNVDKAVLGVKMDISRKTECLNQVKEYFHLPLVQFYFQTYSDPETLENVRKMIVNIKNEFVKLIRKSYWLNETTKNLSIDKIKNLREFIGFPTKSENKSYLNEYYKKVNITSNHLHNVVNLKNFISEEKFKMYKKNVASEMWPSSPFEVNAYYSVLQNAIFIPIGILEQPFFDVNLPDAINYGALGSLIGHEISHALDFAGRHANKYGSIVKWWIDEDIAKYENRAKCYEDLYNSYDVNGRLTIGENIADKVGIDISFLAYKKLKSSKIFRIVPHLETFSNEQLFFLAYSQMWCEITERNDIFLNDEHAPVESRVLGTLNNENFHQYFHCDNLNKQYCKLW